MAWEKYEKNRTKKAEVPYKPSTIREVAKKFLTTTSRIKDIQRGEAITREQVRMNKMLKAEKKEEEAKRKLQELQLERDPTKKKDKKVHPHRNSVHTSCRVKFTSITKTRSFSGPPRFPKGNAFEKLNS